jgi:WD40 repeat protein
MLTLKGHSGCVNTIGFSPDGTRVITGSEDRTVKLWDTKTGAEVLTLKGHTESVQTASFSADGTRIVTGSADYTAVIWDSRPYAENILKSSD